MTNGDNDVRLQWCVANANEVITNTMCTVQIVEYLQSFMCDPSVFLLLKQYFKCQCIHHRLHLLLHLHLWCVVMY